MTSVQVWVQIDGVDLRAGRLHAHTRRGTQSATFLYDADYLADPRAYALDPALPLVAGGLHTGPGRALFGAFTDLAPDRWGRTLVQRAELRAARDQDREPRAVTEFGYLAGVRDDLRQGAVRLRDDDGVWLADEDSGVPALAALPELLTLAARGEEGEATLAELRHLVHAGSSLGGARPKAHLRDVGGRLSIAKFPSARHDAWDVMAWEKVTLDLAADAGVDVPRSRLVEVAGRGVLVLERFDRDDAGNRIGYVSAMTMLEHLDGDRANYVDIADVIERTSPAATTDLRQLWRRMALTVMVSNTDNHLRNHGFLHAGGQSWSLSPAFDMNPDPTGGPALPSTSIDGTGDPASIEALLDVAPWFRLEAEHATRVLAEVAVATTAWRRAASNVGLDDAAIRAMEPAFEHTAARHARTIVVRG